MSHIIVLGAGIAGACVALGLKRLGYQVSICGQPRSFAAVEGISERTLQGLQHAGFHYALQDLPKPSPRQACWNGIRSAANTETLVDRQRFDQGILQDLQTADIPYYEGHIATVNHNNSTHTIQLQQVDSSYVLEADFLVEARGRKAPLSKQSRSYGINTLSILQYWQGKPLAAQSAVESFELGWAWMAALADGSRYLQVTVDTKHTHLPDKQHLAHFCQQQLETLDISPPFLANAQYSGHFHVRNSTPFLAKQVVGEHWIRVGDAAMAVDPLSGNGIFQALSSALQAPAVIHTLLKKKENTHLAQQFHQQRIEHLFQRFSRIGRDFYQQERQWQHPFWQQRKQWPDNQTSHPSIQSGQVTIETRPVLQDDFIEEQEVLITPNQPLGIWQVGGAAIVPLVRQLQNEGGLELKDAVNKLASHLAHHN